MEFSLPAFALVVFIAVVTPGPTVLLALANGSNFGLRRAGFGMAGAALSDLVLITAAALGLGAVLAASAFWFGVVKWVGVAYLAWLGLQMLLSTGGLGAEPERMRQNRQSGSRRQIFRKSFLVAVTNPKGYLFFAAFLPQFVDTGEPLLGQYLALAVIFVLIDLAVMLAYAALGAHAVRFLRDQGALWVDRACGSALLVLAATLSLYRRAGT
jgi:threonine/homoserine/homoserine lactone efflux protein